MLVAMMFRTKENPKSAKRPLITMFYIHPVHVNIIPTVCRRYEYDNLVWESDIKQVWWWTSRQRWRPTRRRRNSPVSLGNQFQWASANDGNCYWQKSFLVTIPIPCICLMKEWTGPANIRPNTELSYLYLYKN